MILRKRPLEEGLHKWIVSCDQIQTISFRRNELESYLYEYLHISIMMIIYIIRNIIYMI